MHFGASLSVFAIRHGEAAHNVAYVKNPTTDIYFEDEKLLDSPLTLSGHREAAEVGSSVSSERFWDWKAEVTMVLVSPLARALQTASGLWREEIRQAGFEFPDWYSEDSAVSKEGPQGWVTESERALASGHAEAGSTATGLANVVPDCDKTILEQRQSKIFCRLRRHETEWDAQAASSPFYRLR